MYNTIRVDNAIDDAAALVLHTLNLANEKIPDILWHSRLTVF
ncbi:hypothetical protein [Candidatus Marithrix sp. Canyon 246]|nr:hypothetical protein [Candidatus Marithrix sp. Canyon 246]